MSTALDNRTDEDVDLELGEPGDHDLFSHYVKKEDIMRSAIEGVPATALCGKKWNPTRDPEKLPICPDCHEIMENVVGTNLPGGGQ